MCPVQTITCAIADILQLYRYTQIVRSIADSLAGAHLLLGALHQRSDWVGHGEADIGRGVSRGSYKLAFLALNIERRLTCIGRGPGMRKALQLLITSD